MAWRESFNVPPMIHQNPIPTASRTGNMLFTSVIGGRDPETGTVPESGEEQAANIFKILRLILDKAGATPGDVAFVTVFIKQPEVRAMVNKPWLEMFPDENNRPARHTHIDPSMGSLVQIEAVAVIEGR
jgi:enamine deaminase RidA (YjgF/YER057c/UK114 family)